jgi:hypothetical protein
VFHNFSNSITVERKVATDEETFKQEVHCRNLHHHQASV